MRMRVMCNANVYFVGLVLFFFVILAFFLCYLGCVVVLTVIIMC